MPHGLPPGVTRGPDGKFVKTDEAHPGQTIEFEDLEFFTGEVEIEVGSGDLTGGRNVTEYEGVELLDVGEIVDRNEVAFLLHLEVGHSTWMEGTNNEDQYVHSHVELSARPALAAIHNQADAGETIDDQESVAGDMTGVEKIISSTDDADLLSRPLTSQASRQILDGAGGVGAGGYAEQDQVSGVPPGRWDFDRRDEIYQNGVLYSDGQAGAGFAAGTDFQMVFGIADERHC